MTALISAWIQFRDERAVSLCPTSLASDYVVVEKWLRRCPIQDMTQGRQIMTWLFNQRPPKTTRRVAMYVRSLYRWAVNEDVALIERNPINSFRMPKAPQGEDEIVVIPRKQIPLVMSILGRSRKVSPSWPLYAEWMLQTAMRTGEVRALRWSDLKDNRVLVHQNYTLTHGLKNSTKTNRQRWVPLNTRAQEILTQLDKDGEYLFPWDREAFQSYFYRKMKDAYAAGIIEKRYRPYDLRHTAISRFIEEGIPVAQVAAWCGNSSEVIWKYYAGVSQEYTIPTL